jgi:hypothetical protein
MLTVFNELKKMSEGFYLQGLACMHINDRYKRCEECIDSFLCALLRQRLSILTHVEELALNIWCDLVRLPQVSGKLMNAIGEGVFSFAAKIT